MTFLEWDFPPLANAAKHSTNIKHIMTCNKNIYLKRKKADIGRNKNV